jgi:hypothetical protein
LVVNVCIYVSVCMYNISIIFVSVGGGGGGGGGYSNPVFIYFPVWLFLAHVWYMINPYDLNSVKIAHVAL